MTVHLDPNQVPAFLRTIGGYAGKTFRAEVCESVTVPVTAGLWDGGSRDVYYAVQLASGAWRKLSSDSSPFDPARQEQRVTIEPGFVVVRHGIFCGKDMGLTFYVTALDVAPMLPKPDGALSDRDQTVLNIIGAYMPAYRREYAARAGIDGAGYAAAVEALKAAGYLAGNGGMTVKGKNARKPHRD